MKLVIIAFIFSSQVLCLSTHAAIPQAVLSPAQFEKHGFEVSFELFKSKDNLAPTLYWVNVSAPLRQGSRQLKSFAFSIVDNKKLKVFAPFPRQPTESDRAQGRFLIHYKLRKETTIQVSYSGNAKEDDRTYILRFPKTEQVLLKKVQQLLPEGWSASYEQEYLSLTIQLDKKVFTESLAPNFSGNEKPELSKYSIAFRLAPFVSLAEYSRMKADNLKIRKEIDLQYQKLLNFRMPQKFNTFIPKTEQEKSAVARYESLKESMHDLPEYYFQDLSLNWIFNSPKNRISHPTDVRIAKECEEVTKKVTELLTAYEKEKSEPVTKK